MSYNSGPQLRTDDDGRVRAFGYLITGNETEGYRARAAVPLTASEVASGVRELLFAHHLVDLLILARAELDMRSMVPGQDATLAGGVTGEVLSALADHYRAED